MLLNQGSIGKLALYQHLVSGQTWWTSRIQGSGVQEMNTSSNRLLADSINDIRCSASDRRRFPARPAQHVHRRRNHGKGQIQSALASAHWQKRQKTRRDMQRRTRRSASTIGGAAPDTIIGRAAAD